MAGTSTRNPVDTYMGWLGGPERLVDTVRLVANAPNIDAVVLLLNFDGGAMRMDPVKRAEDLADALVEALPRLRKPLAVVARPPVQAEGFAASMAFQARVSPAGVAIFSSNVRAARALGHLVDWQRSRIDGVKP